jgi:D-alanyl-D-alanine carboxypeptidase (penicillin-binding protein 5/6)|tara:strand:+ start:97 stop:483 length:387 start_codon:yes stop_codon:yes gene_type:complete
MSPSKYRRHPKHRNRHTTPPLPPTTAKAICVIDLRSGRCLAERNATKLHPIASLTKIVTALVTLRLSHQHQISLTETFFTVSKRASKIGGTTANLKPGDTLTILDLLYGLLLPSGNDAVGYYSLTLAP